MGRRKDPLSKRGQLRKRKELRRQSEREHRRRELLRVVMVRSGLGIEEFAAAAGRHRATIYRWLRGESAVPAGMEDWLMSVAPSLIRKGDGDHEDP